MKLHFKYKKTLSSLEKYKIIKIFNLLKTAPYRDRVPGTYIAKKLIIEMPELRTLIQKARENAPLFYKEFGYIIADRRGYLLTKNKELINKYAAKIHKRSNSGIIQVDAAYQITNYRRWNGPNWD